MAEENFYLDLYNEEIESKIKGAVVYNDYQELSEMQKAQARRNIGAGAVDSGLIIKGYYATYEALTAAQPNPQVSDAYGVGTAPPYNIFVWDNINKMWVNNGTITKGDKGDPGKDGEAPTAENIAAALGYTPADADNIVIPNGSVTVEKLAIGAIPEKLTISLSDTWTGDTSPYTQSITISGYTVTLNSKVDIQPSAEVLAQLINDGVLALYIANDDGTLTAVAVGEKPSAAMTIQATIEEVR